MLFSEQYQMSTARLKNKEQKYTNMMYKTHLLIFPVQFVLFDDKALLRPSQGARSVIRQMWHQLIIQRLASNQGGLLSRRNAAGAHWKCHITVINHN